MLVSQLVECGVVHVSAEKAGAASNVYRDISNSKGEDTLIASVVTVSIEFSREYTILDDDEVDVAMQDEVVQDEVCVLHRFLVLGVFDGHAGRLVSKWLEQNYVRECLVPVLLLSVVSTVEDLLLSQFPSASSINGPAVSCTRDTPIGYISADVSAVLHASFSKARDTILAAGRLRRCGSTGVVTVRELLDENAAEIYCACLGDSKALLFGLDGDNQPAWRDLCVTHGAEDPEAQQFARDNGGSVGIFWNGARSVNCMDVLQLGTEGAPVPPLEEGQAVYRMTNGPDPSAALRHGCKVMSFNFSRSFGDYEISHLMRKEPQIVHTMLASEREAEDTVCADVEVRVFDIRQWSRVFLVLASDGLFERRAQLRPVESEVHDDLARHVARLTEEFSHPDYGTAYHRIVCGLLEFARRLGSVDDITVILHPLAV